MILYVSIFPDAKVVSNTSSQTQDAHHSNEKNSQTGTREAVPRDFLQSTRSVAMTISTDTEIFLTGPDGFLKQTSRIVLGPI